MSTVKIFLGASVTEYVYGLTRKYIAKRSFGISQRCLGQLCVCSLVWFGNRDTWVSIKSTLLSLLGKIQ